MIDMIFVMMIDMNPNIGFSTTFFHLKFYIIGEDQQAKQNRRTLVFTPQYQASLPFSQTNL